MNVRSIRFRLAAWQGALFAAVFAVLSVVLYVRVKEYLDSAALQSQARWARQISETLIANAPQTGEDYIHREIKMVYAPELVNRFIRITRQDGTILYRSGPPDDQGFAPSQVPPGRIDASSAYNRVQQLADGNSLLIAAVPTAAAGQSYLVEVGISSDPIDRFGRHLLILLALGIPLVIALAAAGGYLLAKSALKPVEQITMKAELITQHNLTERLPVIPTGDELERLSVALNRMITRLDDAFCNSKRFVADASHELRTPLTVIQGELENLAAEAHTPADWRERLGSMLEEVERLAKIVKKLFALSRLDAGEAQEEWVRLDLAALTAATAAQMALLAEDKQIQLSCETQLPVFVMGDRARLKQVVVNLLDNAIKYTAPNGKVELKVESDARSGILKVSDTGLGIPAEAVSLVFERFYRVDRAHAVDNDGAGLGLAIVKSICSAHGGKVGVESVLGSGSQFLVTLPLAAVES
jgi:heavy metal sensor kinase